MVNEKITFLASFPAIQSAIKITGDGGGMRIQLDIPENQMSEAVKLMLYRQVALRVTIEVDTQSTHCLTMDNSNAVQKGRKRKSEWETTEK